MYIYMRNPKEHERECDSYARGPFSILIMGILCFFFLYICAGMRLCRVQQQFYLLCSKSKPELVILCLGLSIDLEMVKEVRNMKYQVKLMQ